MGTEGHLTTTGTTTTTTSSSPDVDIPRTCSTVHQILRLLQSNDSYSKVQAAKDIRRLTKTSQRYRRHFSPAIKTLVDMLRSNSIEPVQASLPALVNLAVKDELNKMSIVEAGALEPIVRFLQSDNSIMQEQATVSLLTLSACVVNKSKITASGAIAPLVEVLRHGSPQARVDAVMALYNLSTSEDNVALILQAEPIHPLVNLLKICRKSSKTVEKCSALVESLVNFEEARIALTSEEGGVLAVVEVLESGSPLSREHAVGALLTMCESNRCTYREPILREGVIPGLLELTVQGTEKSQLKARALLQLLRDAPYPRSDHQPDTLENIVCNIISQMDEDDHAGKARKMLNEMVQVSMEKSLRHLQRRALRMNMAMDLWIEIKVRLYLLTSHLRVIEE